MSTASPRVSTTPESSKPSPALAALLAEVAARAGRENAFGTVRVDGAMLRCDAKASAAPAEFRLFMDAGKLWVALVTADRWLSQSMEADLVHTGDKVDELIEEELVDLDWNKQWGTPRLPYEHFRDAQKLYTFRSPLPIGLNSPDAAACAATALLGYERAFRPLGDMEADDEE